MHALNGSSEVLDPGEWKVGSQLWSTDTVEPHRRLDFWVETICRSFGSLTCDPLHADGMFGRVETNRIGTLELTHLRAGGQEVRHDRAEDSADGQSYLVHIQKAGRCVVEQDGRVAVALPGDLVLYDRRRPYKLVLDDPAHEVWVLKVERSELERHVADLRDLTAISVKNATPPVRVLSSMCDVLHSSSHLLDPGTCESMSEAVYSTVSACLRSLPPARVRKNSSLKAYHIARVKAYVNQNLRDPTLSIASIARALQMSPDHLCRLFRDEPQPLSRWLWAQRLDACKRDLCDPRLHRRSISDLAFSWGFNEAAHFSRSFREQFGISARELRARDAAGVEPATNKVTRLRTIGS